MYYNTPYLSWQNAIKRDDTDDVIRNATYLNTENPNAAFINKFYGWTAVHIDGNGVVLPGTPQILAVDDNYLVPWRLALKILPNRIERLKLSITGVAAIGTTTAELDSLTYIFHALFKSSEKITIETSLQTDSPASSIAPVITNFDAVDEYLTVRSNFVELSPNNDLPSSSYTGSDITFTITITITNHGGNGQTLYMTCPFLYQENEYKQNPFVSNSTKYIPQVLLEIDQAQTPQYPMSKLMHALNYSSAQTSALTARFWKLDLEELPVEYDGTENFAKSKLVDPNLADYEYLDWLAQFNGTSLRGNIYAPNPADATQTQSLSVRAATTANGVLATAYNPGDVVDGVTLIAGNRILLKNQTAAEDNGIYVINPVGHLTQGHTTFTASGTSVTAAATYTGVTQSATDGSGTGAVFTITKTGSGTDYAGVTTVTITSGGSGYAVGNTITIPGASLGGATSANNLTLTVGGTVGAPTRASDMPAGVLNISAGFSILVRDGTLNSGTIWRLTNGSNPTVGSTALTFGIKQISVVAATTVAGTLGSSFENGDTIDNVALVTNNKILVKNQADPIANGVYVVNPAGHLTQGSTTFSASGTSVAAAATYNGVTQSATNGSGTGAVFTITKTGSGTLYAGVTTVTVTSGGSGYAVGDTITIPGGSLGGATSANNLTLTVGGMVGAPTRVATLPAALVLSNYLDVFVTGGLTNKYKIFRSTSPSATIGTNSLNFSEVALNAYEADVDAFARWQISNGYWGHKAGTREAFDGILDRYLTGTKYRTYTLTGFLLSIKTLYDETPWAAGGYSPLLEALLEPARPAGYKLTVNVVHDLRFTFNSNTLGQFNNDPLG